MDTHHHHDDHHGVHGAGCAHHRHVGTAAAEHDDTRRLAIALVIIAAFAVVEVIGGLISNSLALLADAGHMLTDGIAIALALWARHLARAPSSDTMPYGRKRAQVLAAFVNGLALFVLIAFLITESISRVASPEEIGARTMLIVALIGLGANLAAFFVLHHGDTTDINMRGALLHVMGDLLGSVAAIVSALIIAGTGWLLADPLVTLLVCALIARSALALVREATHVLLQGAPPTVDVEAIKKGLLHDVPELRDIHDVKIWMLTPDNAQLTMHAAVHDASHGNAALRGAKAWLAAHYGIRESIIQIETIDPEAADRVDVEMGPEARAAFCPDAAPVRSRASAPRKAVAVPLHQIG